MGPPRVSARGARPGLRWPALAGCAALLAGCASYGHRGPPAPFRPAGGEILDLEIAEPPRVRQGDGGENPVIATLSSRTVRAADLGTFILRTHRDEALASLSRLIAGVVAGEEARRIGLLCPDRHLQEFRAGLAEELAREAAIAFGAGAGAGVLVEARDGMGLDEYLDRRCESERDRYLFERLVRYHGIREDRIDLSVIATADRESALEVAGRLDEGADFSRLAELYSLDASSAAGGRLPPLSRAALDPPVADLVFALKPGERTGILANSGGDGRRLFQIFRVNAHLPGKPSGYQDVEREVEESLAGRAVSQDEWAAWYRAMERLYKVRLSPNL